MLERRKTRSTESLLGASVLTGFLLLALFAYQLAPYDPSASSGAPFERPSVAHWLGTNDLGQDILSELIVGTRVSLLVGLSAALGAVVIGTLVGLAAGYFGGWLDDWLMRLVDLALVVPFLPLVIVVAAYLGPNLVNLIALIVLVLWARPARVIRSSVLAVRGVSYLEAARALGARDRYLIIRHVLPAVFPIVLSQLLMVASSAILLEASLAFLGLGDPVRKSWGSMLYYAQVRGAFLNGSWPWWVLPPGLLIAMFVLGFALLGTGLRGSRD